MKYLITLLIVLLGSVPVMAEQLVTIKWEAGNCKDIFRVYRYSSVGGWIRIAETYESKLDIVVPDRNIRWRISGVCDSGINKGEWWLNNGIWTGINVNKDIKKRK
jgi:hypothetical protein